MYIQTDGLENIYNITLKIFVYVISANEIPLSVRLPQMCHIV